MFTTFTVKDTNYKLRLDAKACVSLEDRLGTNPLNVIIQMIQGNTIKMPSLKVLLTIIHEALQPYNHGISMDDVYAIYDDYIADGHAMADLIPVILDIFKTSGFIKKPAEDVEDSESSKN